MAGNKIDFKNIIIENFVKLRDIEFANNQPYKARAYNVVLKQIQNIQFPIYTMDDLVTIKGIGEKIHKKLKEIFNTGKISKVEEAGKSIFIFNQLISIHGIGPVKANELITKHNITSIEDLKQNRYLLNDIQQIGLKHYQDFIQRIQRDEMIEHEKYLIDTAYIVCRKHCTNVQVTLTGSYRRGESSSGDIDVLVTGCKKDMFQRIIQKLIDDGYITDILARGPKKVLAVAKLTNINIYRRIDLMLTNELEYPFALIYFTGNGPFNVLMRKIALSKGYSMNEKGFKYAFGKNNNKAVIEINGIPIHNILNTEQTIFEFLGIDYIPPNKRYPEALNKYI